jgi:transposase
MGKKNKEIRAGIDISAKKLNVAIRLLTGEVKDLEFTNDTEGHKKLTQLLTKGGRPARAVCEATSLYGLDLCLALNAAGVGVMVVNPKAARRFMEAQMRRAKTDTVDARALLDFLERMEFVLWSPPSAAVLTLRMLARRIGDLNKMQTAEKNRLHALHATESTPEVVLEDLKEAIAGLEKRIDALVTAAVAHIEAHAELREPFKLAKTIKGIAERSGVALLGELLLLPADMTPREVVAHAGLDPRPKDSGTKTSKRSISKVGNAVIRGALYMPTLSAIQHEPTVKRHYEALVADGRQEKKLVAITAVSRKLLQSLWRMLRTGTAWDPARFSPRFATENATAQP